MIIYECTGHYRQREAGQCLICHAKLQAREISKDYKVQPLD